MAHWLQCRSHISKICNCCMSARQFICKWIERDIKFFFFFWTGLMSYSQRKEILPSNWTCGASIFHMHTQREQGLGLMNWDLPRSQSTLAENLDFLPLISFWIKQRSRKYLPHLRQITGLVCISIAVQLKDFLCLVLSLRFQGPIALWWISTQVILLWSMNTWAMWLHKMQHFIVMIGLQVS